jgi:hypothetical protein
LKNVFLDSGMPVEVLIVMADPVNHAVIPGAMKNISCPRQPALYVAGITM